MDSWCLLDCPILIGFFSTFMFLIISQSISDDEIILQHRPANVKPQRKQIFIIKLHLNENKDKKQRERSFGFVGGGGLYVGIKEDRLFMTSSYLGKIG